MKERDIIQSVIKRLSLIFERTTYALQKRCSTLELTGAMGVGGLEPHEINSQQILSLVRLPIPPHSQKNQG